MTYGSNASLLHIGHQEYVNIPDIAELDTICFLNKFYQDIPGVNEIYKLIRSLKTTFSSIPVEMLKEEKIFKGNKEIDSAFNDFFVHNL